MTETANSSPFPKSLNSVHLRITDLPGKLLGRRRAASDSALGLFCPSPHAVSSLPQARSAPALCRASGMPGAACSSWTTSLQGQACQDFNSAHAAPLQTRQPAPRALPPHPRRASLNPRSPTRGLLHPAGDGDDPTGLHLALRTATQTVRTETEAPAGIRLPGASLSVARLCSECGLAVF